MKSFSRYWMLALTVGLFACESPVEPPGPRPRVSVSVAHGHAAADQLEFGGQTLDEVVVVVSAVELHACEPEQGSASFELIPSAYAHVPSSSTRLGTPAATALFDGRESSRVVGELGVPLETFCKAWLVLAPADDDVLNVTSVEDADLVGSTVVAVDDAGTVFKSSGTRLIEVEIDDPNAPKPLSFDKPGSGPMLLFDLEVEPFEGDVVADDQLADRVLDNLSVELRRFHDGTK